MFTIRASLWSLVFVVASFLASSVANAELFRIENRQYGSTPQEIVDPVFNALENSVNENLPNADTSGYLKGVSNATAISGAGIGTDYVSPFDSFFLSARVGAGADLGTGGSLGSITDINSVGGVGGQAAIVIGVTGSRFFKSRKRSFFGADRFKLFFHFFTKSMTFDDISANTTSFGLHTQYRLFYPSGVLGKLLRWNGLDFTLGARKASTNLTITKAVQETSTDAGPPEITMTFDGTVTVGADVDVFTIPLDISTSVTFLYVLSLYTGFSFDYNFGSATSSTNLSGPIVVSNPAGVSGDATLNLGDDSSPTAGRVSFFAGFQLDLAVLGLYAQFTQSLSNNSIAASAGLNLFW